MPVNVVWSVAAERSGGNISETNLSTGRVLVKSLTRSNSVPETLQPVRPRMARTARVVLQEKRGIAPAIRGWLVGGDAIAALRYPDRVRLLSAVARDFGVGTGPRQRGPVRIPDVDPF